MKCSLSILRRNNEMLNVMHAYNICINNYVHVYVDMMHVVVRNIDKHYILDNYKSLKAKSTKIL